MVMTLLTGDVVGDDLGNGGKVLVAERGETSGSRQNLSDVRAQQRHVLAQQRSSTAHLSVCTCAQTLRQFYCIKKQ